MTGVHTAVKKGDHCSDNLLHTAVTYGAMITMMYTFIISVVSAYEFSITGVYIYLIPFDIHTNFSLVTMYI